MGAIRRFLRVTSRPAGRYCVVQARLAGGGGKGDGADGRGKAADAQPEAAAGQAVDEASKSIVRAGTTEAAPVERATDALYQKEREGSGGFAEARASVARLQARRGELFSDPAFVERQLGRVPDSYSLLRGIDKDGNIEASIIHKNSKVMPGMIMTAALLFGGVTVYYGFKNEEKRYSKDFQQREEGAAYIGTPKLGGPFELTEVRSKTKLKSEDLKGKWLYIYFGFCNCPDVCPDEMKKLSYVTVRMQEVMGDLFQPVFITVDPKRDDCDAVAEYLSDYHPSILGFSGTPEEVEKVTKKFRVFHAVPDVETFTDTDYLVDHSIIMYLMDPTGKFCEFTTKEYSAAEASAKIRSAIKDWENDMLRKGMTDSVETPITQSESLKGVRVGRV
ncbi:Protein sco1 [Diplonema papillatum]|nr:Protein sco1 [Diplonema papillatum]